MNRGLRHHVLNGMNVILGEVERLDRETASEGATTTIRRRGEEIVDRIESVQTIVQAFVDEGTAPLDERDLSAVLADVVEQVDDRYGDAVISADIPEGITVSADRFLPEVFENLLSNAIVHNDRESPRVRVSLTVDEGTAVVRIADNGPGIPDDQKESLFRWEEPTGGEIRTGVGLAIVNVLVDRYDGHVRVADNDPRGTVVFVELVRA